MEASFDFYKCLRGLVGQVPEGRVTTPRLLAEALGDPMAARAVSETLSRSEFDSVKRKVVPGSSRPFSGFETSRPLARLSETQRKMAGKVETRASPGSWERIAGVDASYKGDVAYAACVVMDRDLEILESYTAKIDVGFPYIPGYLSYREAPTILAVVERVSDLDILMVNGHGVAHPRGCGLASSVGVLLGVPTVGIARTPLVGEIREGSTGYKPLIFKGKRVGAEISMESGASVIASVGHLMDLEGCVEVIKNTWISGNLPEPLRAAHLLARETLRRSR